MNIREERVNNDLFLVIRLFWVKFFPRPMWRVQAGVKGWYITCYLSLGKPPWKRNVFFRASFYLIDLVSITSMAIWRGGLTWNYQFIHQDQREVIKNSLFMQKSGIDCFYRKATKTLRCDRFKKQIEKKVLKKLWSVQKKDWKKSLKKVVIGLRGRAAARSGLPTPLGDPTIHFCQRTFANCHFLFLFVFVLHI